ncbi:helix-turn-helix domain-containing protein [Nocardiopsis sp. NPDC006938]|uniref:helix-turn-helix domain-containing protein n=1 Tax=Nocardiopsis sp. NPDC006938 TaxID=3364337 RepID=UPI0036B097D4
MDQKRKSPTLRRRRLSRTLRALREGSGKTLHEAAAEAGTTASKLSRMENTGVQRPSPGDVARLADVYGVGTDTRELLMELVRDSGTRGWWDGRPGPRDHALLPDLEAEAAALRVHAPHRVPDLFQTPRYAEAVLEARPGGTGPEAAGLMEAHGLRRQLLNEIRPPRVTAVVDEAVLHRRVGGPEVMREQLEHLGHLAVRHNVTVRVLPLGAPGHPAQEGPFTLLEFPEADDDAVVHVGTVSASLYLEEERDVAAHRAVFTVLEAAALSGEESAARVAEAVDHWTPARAG